MQYNRTMVANAKERKALRHASKDATSKLVLLMNHYHALDLRYFATNDLREKEKSEIKQQINRLKSILPDSVRSRVPQWLLDGALWREELDSVHCPL